MALNPNETYRPAGIDFDPPTPDQRALVARVQARRISLMADQQLLRARYEEVMQWINPPWDPISRRVDPQPDAATTDRLGRGVLHVDLTNPAVDRWAVLQLGEPPIFRVRPKYVQAPVDHPDDPEKTAYDRKQYQLDRAIAQNQSSQMEAQSQEWAEHADLHRTLFWAAWAKEAFGKSIIKTGWDPDTDLPTAELYENPSQVYYGWSKRYGLRRLSWAIVADEMSPEEAGLRYGIDLPLDDGGALDLASWTGTLDKGDMDMRQEQQAATSRFVYVEESWEVKKAADGRIGVEQALILAGRVIEGPTWYPWSKLPFHVFENQHIPTWQHGKSTAEQVIPINASLDAMWDRQREVIDFEAGPRFKGMNMANSGDEVDVPEAFHMIPLREGEDILQLDTRVDFFPTELHSNQMYEGLHRSTGLTPIAWGMSPNAQTSGRAMSAEWRAVELPLTGRLINMGPEVKAIMECWWDYAETYVSEAKAVAKGYRRFVIVWIPIDIRDATEKTQDIIARLNNGMLDFQTAIEESGKENSDEIWAKVRADWVDPVANPLRYQQYLTLQQLELTIRQSQLQVAQMEAQAQQAGAAAQPGGAPGGPGGPTPDELGQQGVNAAGAAAQQGPQGSPSQNQPGGGALPVDTSILSQTPLEGGIGNRAIVNPAGGGGTPAGPAPASGVTPR